LLRAFKPVLNFETVLTFSVILNTWKLSIVRYVLMGHCQWSIMDIVTSVIRQWIFAFFF